MTDTLSLTGAWSAPLPNQQVLGNAAIAVVGEDEYLIEYAGASSPDRPIHVAAWQHGDQPRDSAQLVEEIVAVGATVVCIGPDVALPAALGVTAIVDRSHPDLSVVLVASPDPDAWREALRAGVRDVVEPWKLDTDLAPAISRGLERAARVREQWAAPAVPEAPELPETGRVIVVISPKGGSGKTMVASNLAAALARAGAGAVALVDLDVQFGDSATALGLLPERSIADLAAMPAIDSTTLKVYLTQHEASGAFVLCGADSPELGDEVTAEHAGRIVDLLAVDFDFAVVDTPAGLDERTLAVLERATDVVCVTSTDVSSIRGMGKELAVLERLGLLQGQRHFVLNRADAKVGIDVGDVEAALAMPVNAAVPSSRAIPLSMNQGRPIVLDAPNTPVAKELTKLAHRIEGRQGARRSFWRKGQK